MGLSKGTRKIRPLIQGCRWGLFWKRAARMCRYSSFFIIWNQKSVLRSLCPRRSIRVVLTKTQYICSLCLFWYVQSRLLTDNPWMYSYANRSRGHNMSHKYLWLHYKSLDPRQTMRQKHIRPWSRPLWKNLEEWQGLLKHQYIHTWNVSKILCHTAYTRRGHRENPQPIQT